jgi:periplasmic divalent cation tolerance protein
MRWPPGLRRAERVTRPVPADTMVESALPGARSPEPDPDPEPEPEPGPGSGARADADRPKEPAVPDPTTPRTSPPGDPAETALHPDSAPSATACLTVLTTTDSAAEAERLAAGAVAARLAACAQISAPVTSVYVWEGAVRTEQEWQILFKTTAAGYDALEAHLRAEHDYDTPEIIATPVVRGSADYLAWVAAETGAP